MRIKIIEVGELVKEKTGKGFYFHFTVTYDKGDVKPWKRKLVSFAKPDIAYNVLKNAKVGEEYYVEQSKDEQGNWQWPNVTKAGEEPPMNNEVVGRKVETFDSRQQSIVRQSVLKTAVEFHGDVGVEEVLATAEKFEAWVNR